MIEQNIKTDEGGNKAEEMNKNIKTEDNMEEDPEDDIFKSGILEEYKEIDYYGQPYTSESSSQIIADIKAAEINNKRTQYYKYVISRQKREFEAPFPFNDKDPGNEGTTDIKPLKTNEFANTERAILEIELQTANDESKKVYQIPKVRLQNAFTNTEEDIHEVMERYRAKANFYLTNDQR